LAVGGKNLLWGNPAARFHNRQGPTQKHHVMKAWSIPAASRRKQPKFKERLQGNP